MSREAIKKIAVLRTNFNYPASFFVVLCKCIDTITPCFNLNHVLSSSGWNRYRLGNRSDTIGWSWPTDPIVRSLTDSGQRVRVSKKKEKRVRVSKKLAQNWLLLLVSPRQPQILLTVGLSPFKDSLLGLF